MIDEPSGSTLAQPALLLKFGDKLIRFRENRRQWRVARRLVYAAGL